MLKWATKQILLANKRLQVLDLKPEVPATIAEALEDVKVTSTSLNSLWPPVNDFVLKAFATVLLKSTGNVNWMSLTGLLSVWVCVCVCVCASFWCDSHLTPNICRRSGSRKRKGMLETCNLLGCCFSDESLGCRCSCWEPSVCATSSACCKKDTQYQRLAAMMVKRNIWENYVKVKYEGRGASKKAVLDSTLYFPFPPLG